MNKLTLALVGWTATYQWSLAKSSDDTPRFYTRLNVLAAGTPRFGHPSSKRSLARSRIEQCTQSAPFARKPQRSLSKAEWNKFIIISGPFLGYLIGTYCDYYGWSFGFVRLMNLVVIHGNCFRKSLCRVTSTLIDLCWGWEFLWLFIRCLVNCITGRLTGQQEQHGG